jgi:hypothetical protein
VDAAQCDAAGFAGKKGLSTGPLAPSGSAGVVHGAPATALRRSRSRHHRPRFDLTAQGVERVAHLVGEGGPPALISQYAPCRSDSERSPASV